MPRVKLPREAFRRVLKRSTVNKEERDRISKLIGDGANTTKVTLNVDDVPDEFLYSLLAEPGLNANQRGMISMRVHGVSGNRDDYDRIYQSKVATPVEFASMFSALGVQNPNCEMLLNGRWYPISLGTACQEDESRLICSVSLTGFISICDTTENAFYPIRRSLFQDQTGEQVERTVAEVLVDVGLRPLTASNSDHNLKLLNAERLAMETGKLMWLSGPVLMRTGYEWWSRLQQIALGSKESPRKVIVDAELESQDSHRGYYGQGDRDAASRLPFVRLFSLDSKKYIYADVEDLVEYEFDHSAIDRLHLPDRMLGILTKVFSAPTEAVFGDVIAGKHGGIVILASGKPGVGKTLTAEVYAETTSRPLYVLELGELGTKASEVEENLSRLFTRVARWNAVLQFDECEIFLAQRGNDLERSAIVGIFLRLLDYYRGILFLTTNRPEVLDLAILSRVTLELKYPDLDSESRNVIWKTMSNLAELKGIGPEQLTELSSLPLNGRQIRNLVRLAKLLHENEAVDIEQIKEIAQNAIAHNALNDADA